MFKRPGRGAVVVVTDVYIASHEVIKSGANNGRPYTSFRIVSTTTSGRQYTVDRRYRQFAELNHILVKAFPHDRLSFPKKRRVLSNFSSRFLLQRQELLATYLGEVVRRPHLRRLRIVSDFLVATRWSGAGVVRAALRASSGEADGIGEGSPRKGKLRLLDDNGGSEESDARFSAALRELADLRLPSEVREAEERERGFRPPQSVEPQSSDDALLMTPDQSLVESSTDTDFITAATPQRKSSVVLPAGQPEDRPRAMSTTRAASPTWSTLRPMKHNLRHSPSGAEWTELDRRRLTLDDAFEWRDIGRRCSGLYRSPRNDRQVSVTVFVLAPGLVTTTRHRWNESAHLVAQFNSANVLKLIGVVTADDPPLFVQEVGNRGTLNTVLRQMSEPPFNAEPASMEQLTGYCEGVAKGLAYLHDLHNFVHGSISTYAVEVGRHNVPKIAVLDTDFGVSRKRWSAPSLLYGADLIKAHDVWAFGALCVEVFSSGQQPFADLSDDEVYDLVMKSYYTSVNGGRGAALAEPVHPCPPQCPPTVWGPVIRPCLNIVDSARPQISAVLAEIHAALHGFNEQHARARAHTIDDPSTRSRPDFDPASVWAHAQAPTPPPLAEPASSTASVYEDEADGNDVLNTSSQSVLFGRVWVAQAAPESLGKTSLTPSLTPSDLSPSVSPPSNRAEG